MKKLDYNIKLYYRNYVFILIIVGVTLFLPTELGIWYKTNPKSSFAPLDIIIISNIKLFLCSVCFALLYEGIISIYKKLK
jgi:hypothetical protein